MRANSVGFLMTIFSFSCTRAFAFAFFIINFFGINKLLAYEVDSVVVTATRQEQRANESIASITVIEREELDRFGASTLGEVVSRSVGVEVSRQGSAGAPESVFIRGANSGHTLVLIDGIRLGSASLGTTALEAIPLDQVKRIEILRGPSSALYGSDAIGGVINVITQTPGVDAGPTLRASAGVGSQGTVMTHASFAKKHEATSYVISVGAAKSKGINALITKSDPAYNSDKDGYSNKNFGMNIAHEFDKNFVIGGGLLESSNKNKYDSYQTDPNTWAISNSGLDYRRSQKITESNLYAKLSPVENWFSTFRLANGTDYSEQPSSSSIVGSPNSTFETTQRQYMWQNDFKLPIGKALISVERLEQKLSSSSVYTSSARATNAYAAGWNGRLGSNNFQFNFRQDRNTQFGVKNTEFLGYGYQISPYWNMATSVSTAFKAPTFNDLYFPVTPGVGGGNLNLKTEESKNREISLRYGDGKVLGHLTYFDNRLKNLIQWADANDGTFEWYPFNTESARIKGEEVGISVKSNSWKYKADVTLQDPKDTNSGMQLISRAKRHTNLSSYYSEANYMLGAEIKYVGTRYYDSTNSLPMGGYSLVNIFGEYKLTDELRAIAHINNLFDRSYEMARSSSGVFGVPGISAFVGVRYSMR